MDPTEKLLQTSLQTAKMGSSSINTILPKVSDASMRNLLVKDLESYDEVAGRAETELQNRSVDTKNHHMVGEMMANLAIQMKTTMDNSASHLAEMMIQGANMGVIEIVRSQNGAKDAAPMSHQIATDVINISTRVVNEMKPYL